MKQLCTPLLFATLLLKRNYRFFQACRSVYICGLTTISLCLSAEEIEDVLSKDPFSYLGSISAFFITPKEIENRLFNDGLALEGTTVANGGVGGRLWWLKVMTKSSGVL